MPVKCKQCCCASHHKLADHTLKRGAVPQLAKGAVPKLACDLSDIKLTFCEGDDGLKGSDKFKSFNQMIFSCELTLNK